LGRYDSPWPGLQPWVPLDLTRRDLIGRAIVGGGALLARPQLAFAGWQGESVFEMRLPGSAGAHAAGGRWASPAIRAPKRFELVGIEWAGPDPQIQVRAKLADGTWSGWLDAPAGHGHGPDESNGSRQLTDPVWTGPAHWFELRAARPLGDARVVFVDANSAAATAAAARYVQTGLAAGPGQPRIVARSSWATTSCKPRVPWLYGAVDLAFVHHTVSANYYRPGQSAGMVRSICLFHKYGNGWNDIGYNFVVDRYGQIFEARAGGIDEPIVGAQAGGYNVYSSGVALLGSFSGAAPSRAAFDALSKLLAWKLTLHGISVDGKVTVEVTRTGAPYSRYRAGARVPLDRISGHRDADTTSCPGNGLYRQLPRLRQIVRRLAGTVSALSAQAAPAGPGAAAITGVLTAADAPIPGATIELQRRTTRGPTTIAEATTAEDGTWSSAAALATNASLRAVYRGDSGHSAVVSLPVDVTVAPQITLAAAAQQVAPGGVIQFTGAIAPTKTKLSIVISQLQADGTFTPVRIVPFTAESDGSFARTLGFPAAGQYQAVAQTTADAENAAGTSPPVTITVA
jgi:hypothetical protein